MPDLLVSMSFRGSRPKVLRNLARIRTVGGVYGIYRTTPSDAEALMSSLTTLDLSGRVVAHSNGLRKIEVGQLNTLIHQVLGRSHDISQ